MSNSTPESNKTALQIALPVALAICALWFASPFLLRFLLRHCALDEWAKYGSFGDTFGAINALFSGLALAGVIAAIWLQTRELKHQYEELRVQNKALELQVEELAGQRKELEETRQVMERQLAQFVTQGAALERQNFERSFFELLTMHHSIVSAVTYPQPGRDRTGRDAFVFFKDEMNKEVQRRHEENDKSQIVREAYKAFMHNYQSYVGHYFRHLYTTIKFVDNSAVQDKKFYTNIVRAQLSSSELALLYYNCLTDFGEKFKPFLSTYALLHNMREIDVHEKVRGLYESAVFGDQRA